jgi:hypothetical protein
MVWVIDILEEGQLMARAMAIKEEKWFTPSSLGNRSSFSMCCRKRTKSSDVIEPFSVLQTMQGTFFPL